MNDLSKKSTISKQYLYNLKYKSKIGLKTYKKLAKALNIDISILKSLPLQKSKENV
jgi:DNA-binding phage protein